MTTPEIELSLVIPVYNEEENLTELIARTTAACDKLDCTTEIILVDDGSADRSMEMIIEASQKDPRIVGVILTSNFGQHAALMAGYHYVSGDIIVCMDDDGQTPANEVDKLLAKIDEGYDVVYAKYEHKQQSIFRNVGSVFNKKLTEVMLEAPKELYISSYFAARRFIIDEVLRYKNAYPYVIGLILRATKNICNVPVSHRERLEGKSGYSLRKLIALWVNGFTSFSVIPLRIATYTGSLVAFAGFIYAIVTIIRKLLDPDIPVGWSSTFSTILIIGGFILLVLGMIGEYVGRIYISLNNSPQYVIRSVINYNEDPKAGE